MAAPDEASLSWPDHPLAVSGDEILATRILPLMGHNARDFARAAAVCRGWRAACRAVSPTLTLYRETALTWMENGQIVYVVWSPCGKFFAVAPYDPPRIFIWRASTGALVNEWALATLATAVPQNFLGPYVSAGVVFSRDSTWVLTFIYDSTHFTIWSVPDGQLVAVNRGDPGGVRYDCADFGVPGSASDGLLGLYSEDSGAIDLWDVLLLPEGGPSRPQQRSRVNLARAEVYVGSNDLAICFSFSPNGSKFVVTCDRAAYVYDVASLARLGAYTSPANFNHEPQWRPVMLSRAVWALDGLHALVSMAESMCAWDFSRPEAPTVVTVDVGPDAYLHSWSPSGASYFVISEFEGQAPGGPATSALEERRVADRSLIRAVSLGPRDYDYRVSMSPDAHALVLCAYRDIRAPRVVVFE